MINSHFSLRTLTLALVLALGAFASAAGTAAADTAKAPYLSPGPIVLNAARDTAYTALTTAGGVAVTDLKSGKTTARWATTQSDPADIALSPDGARLYVSVGENSNGEINIFDTATGKRSAAFAAGHAPGALAVSPDGKTLYVAGRFTNDIRVFDVAAGTAGKLRATIPVVREPRKLALTPDGKTLVVTNLLPGQPATDPAVAGSVSLVDTAGARVRANVVLDTGAQSLEGVAISPDGKFAYVVHILSRFGVPLTQLARGWANTGALAIIDIEKGTLFATVLLDDPDNGAANPVGIALANNGTRALITLAGTNELLTLDIGAMTRVLRDFVAGKAKIPYVKEKADLSYSLSFTAAFKKRFLLKGRGPRAVVTLADATGGDGKSDATTATALVSSRFSTDLEKVVLAGSDAFRANITTFSLGNEPPADAVRRGEANFADATICYQQWQSCISCHTDGRADGINWDQVNDGLGNPKNTKSMLFSHVTPPCMITGIRVSAELAVRKGILHTLETRQPESFAADIDAYLRALRPVESPWLAQLRAKDPAGKGKQLFEKAGCADCHSGEYYTDRQLHDVGTGIEEDKGRKFDTPGLRECWRTAPYLYDGRATTIQQLLTTYNKGDTHGFTSNLTKEEIELLALYVLSL
jgi:sugar lactone lactonase YvrE/mono/diheme cytochrome c family protein